MTSKKASIPGVDALFGTPSRGGPDRVLMPEDVQAGIRENPQARMQEDPPSGMPACVPAGMPASNAEVREKFTFRFDASTLLMLERVWAELRGRTGRKIRKSWIVEAALKHVIRDPERALRVLGEEMQRVATA